MFNTFGATVNTDKHFRTLGIIYRVLGWLGVAISGILGIAALTDIIPFIFMPNLELMKMVALFASVILITLLIALTFFKLSKALSSQKKWATEIVGYLVGFMFLFVVPIGTMIGIYTLWVLVQHAKKT